MEDANENVFVDLPNSDMYSGNPVWGGPFHQPYGFQPYQNFFTPHYPVQQSHSDMTSNYDLEGSSESEEEIDYELWYRFPPQASLDEITKTLVFESTPFTENFLSSRK